MPAEFVGGRSWLPVSFSFNRQAASVHWLDFGDHNLAEPFFAQTVKRLRGMKPPAGEHVGEFDAFLDRYAGAASGVPAGIIFHVSRCGSTLLANAMRQCAGAVVLSESRPIAALCNPQVFRNSPFTMPEWRSVREQALHAVVRLYSMAFGGKPMPVVIKCHTASLLVFRLIRAMWPTVPCVIVVRDPLEVMVSNHLRPAGWVRARHAALETKTVFGWSAEEVHALGEADYIARGWGPSLKSPPKRCRQPAGFSTIKT